MNDDLAEGLEIIGGKLQIISPPNNSSASTITIEIIDDEGIKYSYQINKFNILIIIIIDRGVCGNVVPGLKSMCSADALCEVSANGRELLNCSCKEGYLGTGLICLSKCAR